MSDLPRKNGQPWTGVDTQHLRDMYVRKYPNDLIAASLERTPYAIHCKLKSLGLDTEDCNTIPKQPTKEQPLMENRTVTTKTFVGNTDAATLSVEQLLSLMEQERGFIDRLSSLSKSTVIGKLVAKHENNYKQLESLLGVLIEAS